MKIWHILFWVKKRKPWLKNPAFYVRLGNEIERSGIMINNAHKHRRILRYGTVQAGIY